MYGVYGSVGQPKASIAEIVGLTPSSSCFSLAKHMCLSIT